jgi:hypothetical protein
MIILGQIDKFAGLNFSAVRVVTDIIVRSQPALMEILDLVYPRVVVVRYGAKYLVR